MSAPEHIQESDAIGSRIKLTRNAKGDCQFEVSIREGTDRFEAERIRKLAVEQYLALEEVFELG